MATPDLLSSDTDVTSPENYVSLGASVRNGATENGSLIHRNMAKQPDDERMVELNHQSCQQSAGCKDFDVASDQSHSVANHRPQSATRSTLTRDIPDFQEMTMDKDASRPADGRGPGFRFRANDPPADHQRDSSPINRLAGLFKNLAKF